MTNIEAPFLSRIYMPEKISTQETYPLSIPLFRNCFDLKICKPLTIFVGENGSGKSTLLEAIAYHCGFNLSGGGKSHVYENRNDVSELSKYLRFSWRIRITNGFFMRAESFYNFSSYIDNLAKEEGGSAFTPYGGRSLHEQSHGEAFLSLFMNRLDQKGIYILDEPEAALSPQRQLALIGILTKMIKSGRHQIIMATHSPMLMATPGAELLFIENGEIFEKHYSATEHYRIMKRFLLDPDYINSNIDVD